MNKKNKVPFFASLQVKYALSYFVIFAVVLVLLNTYPLWHLRSCCLPPSGTR